MAGGKAALLALALVALTAVSTAAAAREKGTIMRRALQTDGQDTTQSQDPLSQLLSNAITFLQNDPTQQIQADIQNAVSGIDKAVNQIPAVADFQKQMVDALQQVQLIANQISTQDEGLAQDIQKQVADVVSNMSQGNSDPIDSAVINTINAWAPIAGR